MFRALRQKLAQGLTKTRDALVGGLGRLVRPGRRVDQDLLAELEELLIASDLGPQLAEKLCQQIDQRARGRELQSLTDLTDLLRVEVAQLLPGRFVEQLPPHPPRVTLMIGVNGSGKTTTTGKLAARWAHDGRKVVVAAADTFRAAAIEQLCVWAERAGAHVVRAHHGADPAAVAFDAIKAAIARGSDELLIDTAGRLHNKKPLMDELEKIARVVGRELPGAPHQTLLVLDAGTGRNAVTQAREFARLTAVHGLVLTKLDGTAKGGFIVTIGAELALPVSYVGVGEGVDDLLDFDQDEFLAGLLTPHTPQGAIAETP
jgi:fused signal recognition particle receptor